MKREIYHHLLFLLLPALFFACSSDDNILSEDRYPILLSGSSVSSVVSRADETTPFAEGQTVGMFINENTMTTPVVEYKQNLEFTAASGGALNYAGAKANIPYYPQNGNEVTISAYSPYNENWTTTTNQKFAVKSDQSSDDNYTASDLLFSAPTNYAKQSSAHSLTFNHKLSRLSYTLIAGEGLKDDDLIDATVTFINLYPEVALNLSDGILSTASGNATSLMPHAANGAIAPPQTISADTKLMEIMIGNRPYYYTPSSDITLEMGMQTTFRITVNQTEISVTYKVLEWDEGTVEDDSPTANER